MKSYYTVPEISSLKDNGIKEFNTVKLFSNCLRLVNLDGLFVRVEINSTDKYVEIKSAKEVDLSKYNQMFESLFNFFYSKGYLFGIVKDGNFAVYDAFANDNYFSTKDLKFLKENFNLPIVESIIENTNSDTLFEILKNSSDNIYVLPSVYIDYRDCTANNYSPTITKVIIGEKKYGYYGYNYQNKVAETKTQTPSIPTTNKTTIDSSSSSESIIDAITCGSSDDVRLLLCSTLTKDEIVQMAKECKKNVLNYMTKNAGKFYKEDLIFFKNFGEIMCKIIGCLSHPKMRKYVYEYYEENSAYFCDVNPVNNWEDVFIEIMETYFYEDLYYSRNSEGLLLDCLTSRDLMSFDRIFYDEFENFHKFYLAETSFNVKKTENKESK